MVFCFMHVLHANPSVSEYLGCFDILATKDMLLELAGQISL